MTDVWEISKYVEAHPENYEQRWRLAKKLYMSWEYRLALEHLQVLKNEWDPKENVRRYLGATLYRLKRFEEAIEELKQAIELFPDELVFREQLAQNYIAMGDKREAANVWDDISKMDPGHRFAKQAAKKLRGTVKEEHKEQVDGGKFGIIDLPCPFCGAENSPDLTLCWQCNGPLPSLSSDLLPPVKPRVKEEVNKLLLAGKIACLLFGAIGIFLVIQFLIGRSTEEGVVRQSMSVHGYFITEMFWTRVMLGIGLLIAWPLFLRLSLYLVGTERIDYDWTLINGIFLALFTFVLTWAPSSLLWSIFVLPAIVSGVLLGKTHGLDWKKALGAWACQGAVCFCIGLVIFGARHGIRFVLDVPFLIGYVQGEASRTVPAITLDEATPLEKQLKWSSTGSQWADSHLNQVIFYFDVPKVNGRFLIELRSDEEVLEYHELDGESARFSKSLSPEKDYWLKVIDDGGSPFKLTTKSVLPY
jgi:tetratricopeptide (TPR) repeat protein